MLSKYCKNEFLLLFAMKFLFSILKFRVKQITIFSKMEMSFYMQFCCCYFESSLKNEKDSQYSNVSSLSSATKSTKSNYYYWSRSTVHTYMREFNKLHSTACEMYSKNSAKCNTILSFQSIRSKS